MPPQKQDKKTAKKKSFPAKKKAKSKPAKKSKVNKLYYGDNLAVMRKHIQDESVDLCYIDPPFNSKRNYNQIYNNIGKEDVAQAQAFVDTWTWDDAAESGFAEIISGNNSGLTAQSIELVNGLKQVLGKGSLLSYITHITLRIGEIYRVLKPTGSFYLHCDPSASHYIKLICDAIFCGGRQGQFQNEIIWRRTGSHNTRRSFGPIHDVIFFYTKTSKYTFNIVRRPYMKGHVSSRYSLDGGRLKFTSGGNILTGAGKTNGESGQVWRGFNPSAKNRHWAVPGFLTEDLDEDFHELGVLGKLEALYEMGRIEIKPDTEWPTPVRYLNDGDGQPLQDIWAYQPYTGGTVHDSDEGVDADVQWLGTTSPERLGYPTQKPEGLMERIIEASSNKGDTILDAYCGCGTTISASQKLKRKWIGIDITYQSISLILKRLEDSYGANVLSEIELNGVPKDFEAAEALANKEEDKTRKEFEKWAVLTYSNNRAVINEKKGGDGGIDGTAFIMDYNDKNHSDVRKVVFSVKSNKSLSPTVVRDLFGTVERDGAVMGCLITLYPMVNIVKEAKKYGIYKNRMMGKDFPKIQVISVQEIIDGERMELPASVATVKSAKKKENTGKQQKMQLE